MPCRNLDINAKSLKALWPISLFSKSSWSNCEPQNRLGSWKRVMLGVNRKLSCYFLTRFSQTCRLHPDVTSDRGQLSTFTGLKSGWCKKKKKSKIDFLVLKDVRCFSGQAPILWLSALLFVLLVSPNNQSVPISVGRCQCSDSWLHSTPDTGSSLAKKINAWYIFGGGDSKISHFSPIWTADGSHFGLIFKGLQKMEFCCYISMEPNKRKCLPSSGGGETSIKKKK